MGVIRGGTPETWRVDRIAHPVSPLLVALDAGDQVVAVSLGAKIGSIRDHARRHGARLDVETRCTEAHRQLLAYLHGRRVVFDLPVRLLGTTFQIQVWNALREIPFGETRTYGDQAGRVGRPGAARAVGAANGCNPVPVIVPCHRVVGSNGKLTGFGGGLPLKRWLLDLEAPQVGLGTWMLPRSSGSQLPLL